MLADRPASPSNGPSPREGSRVVPRAVRQPIRAICRRILRRSHGRARAVRQAYALSGDALGRNTISQLFAANAAAEAGRKYLHERGITAESIEKFHLGFSPLDRDWILQQVGKGSTPGSAKKTAGRAKVLEAIGILARPAEGGSYFDRFRGRLLFRSTMRKAGRWASAAGYCRVGTTSPASTSTRPKRRFSRRASCFTGWIWREIRSAARAASTSPP